MALPLVLNDWTVLAQTSNLLDLMQFPFMQRAIAGGVLMGVLGGFLGSFVTLRQLSFFSHAVGHAALAGIVLGVLLQINPTWMLLPFTLAFGVGVLYLIDHTDLWSDNIFSIAVSAALAIGVMLTGLVKGYRGNLMSVLFGDILAIDGLDLALMGLLLVASLLYLLPTLRQQILLTLNPAVAQVQGIVVGFHRYCFVVLLSLAIAVSIKAVGVLLVNAFLVIPASSAKLLSHQFGRFLWLSVGLGALSSLLGMVVSAEFSLASGPSIVLVQFGIFLAAFTLTKLKLVTP